MLTASIVVYNSIWEELYKVISCTIESCVDKVYVIDNSISDILRKDICLISNKIEYIHGQGNVGYGAGHNIAIQKAIKEKAKFHIVINPDIYFEKNVIEGIVQYMSMHEDIGLIMPKILYPNGEIQCLCKLLPTPIDLIGRRFIPWMKYIKKRNKIYELQFTDYNKILEVPSLSGCFMFMRVSVLQEVSGFDERYFMYAEDLDLCRRIGEISKTVYYPLVSVYHGYEKGSYKNRKLLKYHLCSVIKYFNKWGWLFDSKRNEINNRILKQYNI